MFFGSHLFFTPTPGQAQIVSREGRDGGFPAMFCKSQIFYHFSWTGSNFHERGRDGGFSAIVWQVTHFTPFSWTGSNFASHTFFTPSPGQPQIFCNCWASHKIWGPCATAQLAQGKIRL